VRLSENPPKHKDYTGFSLKEKTVEEMKLEKEKYRKLSQAAAKENIK